jgi:hypothetical protein
LFFLLLCRAVCLAIVVLTHYFEFFLAHFA